MRTVENTPKAFKASAAPLRAIANTAPAQGALSVEDFCKQYGVGRDRTYKEIREGRLRAKKMGRRTLIATADAARWLDSLPELKTGKV